MNTFSNWYGVKLLYSFRLSGEPQKDLLDDQFVSGYTAYEESVILVNADDFDHAYERAKVIAEESEVNYQNLYNQEVQKRFCNFLDCYLISTAGEHPLEDGLEVYSNLIDSNTGVSDKRFIEIYYPEKAEGYQHHMLIVKS